VNPKERMLALVIGTVAVAIVGFVGYGWVSGQFANRKTEITRLEGDIQKLKREVMKGQMASQKIAAFEAKSFPKPEIANTLYKDWLFTELEKAGLTKAKVAYQSTHNEKGLYAKQLFNVNAEGSLPQLVDFLHTFYSRDWLHRITSLSITPTKDNHKHLQIGLALDAVSLLKAKDAAELDMRESKRLALASRDEYHRAIVSRNTFGPINKPPKISVAGGTAQNVFLGRTAEVLIKATDPDAIDKVEYRLIESAAPDAKLDAKTGKLTWSPKAEGKYEFIVEGIDDGHPRLTSQREKIVLNVTPQPEEKLAFDDAKYTVLVAVIDVDGQGEVWLHRRAAEQTVKLHVGDNFQVGSIKGTVAEIGELDFSFDADGQRHRLAKGEFLSQAKSVAQPGAAQPAASQPTVAAPAKSTSGEVPVQAKGEDRAS
jgi:hypothetical protein